MDKVNNDIDLICEKVERIKKRIKVIIVHHNELDKVVLSAEKKGIINNSCNKKVINVIIWIIQEVNT